MSLIHHGVLLKNNFVVLSLPPPLFYGFSPNTGTVGTTVEISGVNFINVTSVAVNGVNVSFTVLSPTNIRIVIPVNVSSGHIVITTSYGSIMTPVFVIYSLPAPSNIQVIPNPGSLIVTPFAAIFTMQVLWSAVVGAVGYEFTASSNLGDYFFPRVFSQNFYPQNISSRINDVWTFKVRAKKSDETFGQPSSLTWTAPSSV
jgi:hypothetical protein